MPTTLENWNPGKAENRHPETSNLAEMDALWDKAKAAEKAAK